jgi:hypothetical protein
VVAFFVIFSSTFLASIPLEAKTSSRGLAAPKGFDFEEECDASEAWARAERGFNYEKETKGSAKSKDTAGHFERYAKFRNCPNLTLSARFFHTCSFFL